VSARTARASSSACQSGSDESLPTPRIFAQTAALRRDDNEPQHATRRTAYDGAHDLRLDDADEALAHRCARGCYPSVLPPTLPPARKAARPRLTPPACAHARASTAPAAAGVVCTCAGAGGESGASASAGSPCARPRTGRGCSRRSAPTRRRGCPLARARNENGAFGSVKARPERIRSAAPLSGRDHHARRRTARRFVRACARKWRFVRAIARGGAGAAKRCAGTGTGLLGLLHALLAEPRMDEVVHACAPDTQGAARIPHGRANNSACGRAQETPLHVGESIVLDAHRGRVGWGVRLAFFEVARGGSRSGLGAPV
jgi:hypothetical protein